MRYAPFGAQYKDYNMSLSIFHNGSTPLILAPMAGVSDCAFRRICREHGASLTVTEMISAKAIHYNDIKTAALARIRQDEYPCALQIFGSEPDIMAEAAYRITERSYRGCVSESAPYAIDINMGCPVKKVVSNGEGSALMKDPELIFRIVKAVSEAVGIPVSVKIRAGWDGSHKNAPECAKAAESGGASMICVHGRTRDQMYFPPVDREVIAAVKKAVSLPVIANGGINNAKDALDMLRETGCDGLALARGVRGNPWLFEEINAALKGEKYAPPDEMTRLDTAKYHLSLLKEDKGETSAVLEGRGALIWYVHGMRGAAKFRLDINQAGSTGEMIGLIDKMKDLQAIE